MEQGAAHVRGRTTDRYCAKTGGNRRQQNAGSKRVVPKIDRRDAIRFQKRIVAKARRASEDQG
jgi:hypothetical protein